VSPSLDHVRRLLIDLDGVLYRGNTPLSDAPQFISWLRRRGISFRLVTNNATLTPEQYVNKLDSMGIQVGSDEIVTSALATGMYLRDHRDGTATAQVIGEAGLRAAAEGSGLRLVDEGGDWVVVGLDRTVTYEKLARASLALERGARFVGSNPDTSFPTERGLVPGAGALLATLVATTGRQPVVIGKPEPLMLELAMNSAGGTLQDTAMLGDRLDTDIAAARRLGMTSVLVLTGVSTRADLTGTPTPPDLVVDTLTQLMDTWKGA
jgi:4-nitrophenyl phosphatase